MSMRLFAAAFFFAWLVRIYPHCYPHLSSAPWLIPNPGMGTYWPLHLLAPAPGGQNLTEHTAYNLFALSRIKAGRIFLIDCAIPCESL